jgi:phosphoribosylformylglycinamidine synthase I
VSIERSEARSELMVGRVGIERSEARSELMVGRVGIERSEARSELSVRIGVITFPGSLDDRDAARAISKAEAEPVALWHGDEDLRGVDAVVLPGGFSYGDYLRCGAIARFSPVMTAVIKAAGEGLPVLGICNGFQILCESRLLPGALTRNQHLHFRNRDQRLRIDATATAWTGAFTEGSEITVPVKNGEGCFVADPATLDRLDGEGRVVARYIDGNPNGSQRDIAGIANERGNVVGLMPHPEHAVDPLTGPSRDGLCFFASVIRHLLGVPPAAAR